MVYDIILCGLFCDSAIAILIQDIWSTEYLMRLVDYNTNIPEVFALVGFIYFFVVFGYILLKLRERKT